MRGGRRGGGSDTQEVALNLVQYVHFKTNDPVSSSMTDHQVVPDCIVNLVSRALVLNVDTVLNIDFNP